LSLTITGNKISHRERKNPASAEAHRKRRHELNSQRGSQECYRDRDGNLYWTRDGFCAQEITLVTGAPKEGKKC
jgi:hypothetical protein